MTLNVQTDRSLIRAAGRSTRYVLLSFEAPESANAAARPPIDLSFVIDRSGSMAGSKIDLARKAVVQALRMLRPSDRFSIVVYDDEIDVLVPSTPASAEALRNATTRVECVDARGTTNLGSGWLTGCEELARHAQQGRIGRCLLLSDGLANRGITDRAELARHAEELRARSITTSTIGLGADFDERVLEGMSRAGGGHFYFVEAPVQIADCLTGEVGETLEVVARDVAVVAHASHGVSVTTLNSFRVHQEDGGRTRVLLGDLSSRQEVSLVLRVIFPEGQEGETATIVFDVADAAGAIPAPRADVIWTFASHQANDAQQRNVVVDRTVAHVYAALASADALELNRAGHFEPAIARLEATARRIEQYAGSDRELRAIVASLRERHGVYSQPMMAMKRQSEYYAVQNRVTMRDASGKARQRPNS
jgi:Ca-activated chloride channel family protein